MKTLYLNPVLTGVATRFLATLPLVGTKLFPVFNTQVHAAQYYVYDTSNFTDIPTDIRRAPSAGFKRVTSKLSDDTFLAKDYGIEEAIDKMEMQMYASVFDADKTAMERGVRIVALNHEIRVRDRVRALTQTATPTVKWDASSTTIVKDVQHAKNVIYAATGQDPNLMTVSRQVYNALIEAAELKAYFSNVQGGILTKKNLEAIFQVEEIVVAGDLINTAAEGQVPSLGGIWSDEVVLSISRPSQDLKALNLGRTFNWTALQGSGTKGISTFSYDQNEIDSRVVRARQFTDERVVAQGAGFYLYNVLTD
jgi:hypothetical protein